MTPAELLESIERHFLAGCKGLNIGQLRQHQARGVCAACTEAAAATLRETAETRVEA